MNERLKDVFDGDNILVALPRLAERVGQDALTAIAKFIFIRT